MKILADYHHAGLYRSLELLFARMGGEVHRPIGMEWYRSGYWNVHPSEDTARQYLWPDLDTQGRTLNRVLSKDGGLYHVDDGEGGTHTAVDLMHACLDRYDFLLCSIPQHLPLFMRFQREHQRQAPLIFQIGNAGWQVPPGTNALVSTTAQISNCVSACFYHQELTADFEPCLTPPPTNRVSAYINFMHNDPQAWSDFTWLEERFPGTTWETHGGGCRDGSLPGGPAVAAHTRDSRAVFHVKSVGDGYGHVIFGAFSIGRPTIVRRRFLRRTRAEELLTDGNHIDLDRRSEWRDKLTVVLTDDEEWSRMAMAARLAFEAHVDYAADAARVESWLHTLHA